MFVLSAAGPSGTADAWDQERIEASESGSSSPRRTYHRLHRVSGRQFDGRVGHRPDGMRALVAHADLHILHRHHRAGTQNHIRPGCPRIDETHLLTQRQAHTDRHNPLRIRHQTRQDVGQVIELDRACAPECVNGVWIHP